MTINRPIEKRKQTTPKEIIKKNIFKEIKKQKTPKEIKINKKTNKKRKQKTPKEIKVSPKTIEQHGGTINPPTPNKPMEVKPVEVVIAEPVNPKNNLTGVTKANSRQDIGPTLVNAEQTQNPLVTAEAWYANKNIQVAIENPNESQPNAQLVEAKKVNISPAERTHSQSNEESRESQSNEEPEVPQLNATSLNVIIGNSQTNAIPQQKSSIMTESEFMKKYEITEIQIKQVELLLSNAFAA